MHTLHQYFNPVDHFHLRFKCFLSIGICRNQVRKSCKTAAQRYVRDLQRGLGGCEGTRRGSMQSLIEVSECLILLLLFRDVGLNNVEVQVGCLLQDEQIVSQNRPPLVKFS